MRLFTEKMNCDQGNTRARDGTDLVGANLTGANLTGAFVADANLTRANLTNANLTNANNFRTSKITGVIWSNTTCPNRTVVTSPATANRRDEPDERRCASLPAGGSLVPR